MRQIRGRDIALVLQSPLASLNPALRIGTQMEEAWRAHVCGARVKGMEIPGAGTVRTRQPARR